MKGINPKKVQKRSSGNIKEGIEKLKKENRRLKAENKLLKGLLNSRGGAGVGGKTKGYTTRYSREI